MTRLAQQHCSQTALRPLDATEIEGHLRELQHWQANASQTCIEKTWAFDGYPQTTAFVNAVAELAQREDHHPEICFTYGDCRISLSTHAVNGLSLNDFILAAHIDQLLPPTP